MSTAIGFIETKGMVGMVSATDSAAKAAKVQIVKRIEIGGGFVTTVFSGDVGSVNAAVEAGVATLKANGGQLVASHVIPRPQPGVVEEFTR